MGAALVVTATRLCALYAAVNVMRINIFRLIPILFLGLAAILIGYFMYSDAFCLPLFDAMLDHPNRHQTVVSGDDIQVWWVTIDP